MPDLDGSIVDCVAADDHVGKIERSIRTVKGALRTLLHSLPFRHWPRLMIFEGVRSVVKLKQYFLFLTGFLTH